jgi:hypothetical protein
MYGLPMNDRLDLDVRHHIYDACMRSGAPPHASEVATTQGVSVDDVLASFRRLADGRVVVLQRDGGEILMANPFSAVPTPFVVEAGDLFTYGNCIWDALGIPAMLGRDAKITASCADCGTAAEVVVKDGQVLGEGLVHFAIPAAKWWNDIVFT